MLEHKTARLNPDLKNSKKFKKIVGEKYVPLWDISVSAAAAGSNMVRNLLRIANLFIISYSIQNIPISDIFVLSCHKL
jgi:hypothetical protein